MTRFVTEADVRIFLPGNYGATTPNLTIPGTDIRGLSTTSRAGVSRDLGSVTVNDPDGSYLDFVRPGSQVAFRVQLRGQSSKSVFWAGYLQEHSYSVRPGLPNTLTLDMDGFVGAVLSNRTVTAAWDGAPPSVYAPTSSAPYAGVVNQVIERHCPELSQGFVEASQTRFGDGITMVVQQRDALKLLEDIARRSGSLLSGIGSTVRWRDVGETTPTETLTLADFDLPIDYRTRGDDMATSVRINAGQGSTIGSEELTQASTVSVEKANGTYDKNNGAGFVQLLSLPKPGLLKLGVWTDRATDAGGNKSTDAMVVRLQSTDSSNNPVDPDNRGADIARAKVDAVDLTEGGFTTFALEADDIPTGVVVLIETEGDDVGQLIGVDGSDVLTHKAFVPIPLDARAVNSDASDEYGLREVSLARRDQDSREAVKQQARAELQRQDQPLKQIQSVRATSADAQQLIPLDVVRLEFDGLPIGGEWVVTQKEVDAGDGAQAPNQLEVRLSLRKLNRYQ